MSNLVLPTFSCKHHYTMHRSILLLSADSSLGHIDYDSLSDQTLMEILVDSFFSMEKQKHQDEDGDYLDVCMWPYIYCDASGNVTKVKKVGGMGGSASLSHIPPKVEFFQMPGGRLTGTLETSLLPQGLRHFDIRKNSFRGSANLATLPENLVDFNIYDNAFSGSVDLSKLPASLTELKIGSNNLSGSLCLSCLPRGLRALSLRNNMFSGEFRYENAPSGLRQFYAYGNDFDEVAVVSKDATVTLMADSGVTSVIDEEGGRHRNQRRILTQRPSMKVII